MGGTGLMVRELFEIRGRVVGASKSYAALSLTRSVNKSADRTLMTILATLTAVTSSRDVVNQRSCTSVIMVMTCEVSLEYRPGLASVLGTEPESRDTM